MLLQPNPVKANRQNGTATKENITHPMVKVTIEGATFDQLIKMAG